MNSVLQTWVNWLMQPQTIIAAVTFIASIPHYIDKYKAAQGNNAFEKLKNFAIPEARELAKSNLTDPQKRMELEKKAIDFLGPRGLKYMPPEKMAIVLEGVWHGVVKPGLDKE